jgi:hypothetical protein
MKLIDIQRKKINKLKRKLNKLNKNLSNLEEKEKYDNYFMDKLYIINQNINNLENVVDIFNLELYKNSSANKGKIKDLIKKYEEAQEILDMFLPLMLFHQIVNS